MKTFAPAPSSSNKARQPGQPFAWLAALFWILIIAVSILSFILRLKNQNNTYFNGTSEGLANFLYWGLLIPALAPAYGTVGALVVNRGSRQVTGWLLLLLALCVALQNAAWQCVTGTTDASTDPSLPVYLAAQAANVLSCLFLALPAWLLLTFPTGRFLSGRWKVVSGLLLLVVIVHIAGQCFATTLSMGELQLANPLGLLPFSSGDVDTPCFLIEACCFLLSLISLFVRGRRAGAEERQQLKWLFFLLIIIMGTGLLALAIGSLFPDALVLALGIGVLSVGGISIGFPIIVSLALLRYRFYDVDILVNRTLVYGGLAVLLLLVYLSGVTLLQFLLSGSLPGFLHLSSPSGSVTPPTPTPVQSPTLGHPTPTPVSSGGGKAPANSSFGGLLGGLLPADSPLANVFTTLGVAALFQPLRIWIQRSIDRRFYRRKYDAARALEAFSATLRDQINLEQLHKRILSVVEETMQPMHVSLWLCEPVRPSVPDASFSGPLEPVIRSTGLLTRTGDLKRYL